MLNDWRLANLVTAALIPLAGLVYVGNTWSPSSYGHVLKHQLGYPEGGPDWGVPRPIRSDEWAVVTPLTQATVNNGFQRFNRTSLYDEDLRMNYGLPVWDWGMVFKPTMWLYVLAPPAYAYSAHWFLLTALFLVGYAWLFRWIGASPVVAFALAAGLYYTGFVQFWWNEKASEFALFPWVLLPFATRLPLIWKAALFYSAAVAWLLANFYPPIQISLAFAGLALLLAKAPDLFRPRRLPVIAIAAGLAAGTTICYLWDYLAATSTTIYPGSRRVSGENLPFRLWLSWILPTINFDRHFESFVGGNVCENGTPGLYYTSLIACFLDLTKWRGVCAKAAARREIAVLGIGLAMMLLWMTVAIPSWVGAPLLWNYVQPQRMQYAAGLLLVCLLLVLTRHLGLRFTFLRLTAFLMLVGYGYWAWKFAHGKGSSRDLVILLLAVAAFCVASFRPAIAHGTLAVISLLSGLILFGHFNPLQPARPIFDPPRTPVTAALDQIASSHGGILAVTGLTGAVANGLGYRSLSHVTTTPQIAFWHARFPQLPPDQFEVTFNRYSHIVPMNEGAPRLLQSDAIIVPVNLFQKTAPVRFVSEQVAANGMGGHLEKPFIDRGSLVVSGWGIWSGPPSAHELEILMDPPPAAAPLRAIVVRPDLPAATAQKVAASNGFTLSIPLATSAPPKTLCVFSRDAVLKKRFLLNSPPGAPACPFAPRLQE